MAHAITALRVLLAIPLILIVGGQSPLPVWYAAFLFAIIAASDVVDGRVARAAGTASNWGRGFDHGADIFFVLGTLTTYTWRGIAPWWVPASIAVAFAMYAIDAWRGAAPSPARRAAGRIGHIGGICNYAVIGVLIGNETIGLHLLPPAFIAIMLVAVPVYSLASVVARYVPSGTRSTLTVR